MQEVDLTQFEAAHRLGAVVVDVREAHEYVRGHVPGARLVPLGEVASRISELPTEETIYVICASGTRSLTAARHLAGAGLRACSVAGGTVAWAERRLPLVTGPEPGPGGTAPGTA